MAISTINQNGLTAPLTLTSPVLTTPNLGTPSALVLTNATGTPSAINLTNATALPASALPSGSVIQTVFASTTTSSTVNSTSLVASNLAGTITPQYSNSKILIMYGIGMTATNTANSWNMKNQIYRSISGGSAGFIGTLCGMFSLDARVSGTIFNQSYFQCCQNYLDSPATTSATTYTVYGSITSQSGTAVAGDFLGFNGIGTMVLQEIKQ